MWPSIASNDTPAAPPAAEPRSGAWAAAPAVAVVVAFAGYALLSHWLMVNAPRQPWAVAVLFGPLVGALAASAWAGRRYGLLGACAAGVALLAWIVAHGGVADIQLMYVLQHAGIHVALAFTFASTLRPGATPLITLMAHAVHHRFTPAMQAYTRWLTALWAVYFGAMVAVSLLIYLLAPWPWWSLYGNVLTPLSAALLFIGEHIQRYRRHPEFERVSMRAAIRAYRRVGGDDTGPRP